MSNSYVAEYIFPPTWMLYEQVRRTPIYMHPDDTPYAVVREGAVSPDQCDAILEYMNTLEAYHFPSCVALTREAPQPLDKVFGRLHMEARKLNGRYFGFDLDLGATAWMQSYGVGDHYPKHVDVGPGQSRKLTAILMLSHSRNFAGGRLTLQPLPHQYTIDLKQGSVVVFPSWMVHEVLPVISGRRNTINLGLYGPPFR